MSKKKSADERAESRRAKDAKYREEMSRRFDVLHAANARQKQSINRLLLANTEASAALLEIASGEPVDGQDGWLACVERAQDALSRMTRIASGIGENQEESGENGATDENPADTTEVSKE